MFGLGPIFFSNWVSELGWGHIFKERRLMLIYILWMFRIVRILVCNTHTLGVDTPVVVPLIGFGLGRVTKGFFSGFV